MRDKELLAFIKERESIRVKKEAGKPWPWSKDEILSAYRFCNMHREHDKVTKWIATNWRGPNKDHKDLWFMMVFARLFNNIDTLGYVGIPSPWKPEYVRKALHARAAKGLRVFNPAYIVSTNGVSMDKVDYVVMEILCPLWAGREALRPVATDSLQSFYQRLSLYWGMGSFMSGQVIADLKYVEPLAGALDWWDFVAPGPGSRRGLNRVMERPLDASWPGSTFEFAIAELRGKIHPKFPLHAQDLQNSLCEFDKYERARLGEGRPKQIYRAV